MRASGCEGIPQSLSGMDRRAWLLAGPDVWEVVGAIVGGDVVPGGRARRAGGILGLCPRTCGFVSKSCWQSEATGRGSPFPHCA